MPNNNRDELLEQYMQLQKAQALQEARIEADGNRLVAGQPIINQVSGVNMEPAGKPNREVVDHAAAVNQFNKVVGPEVPMRQQSSTIKAGEPLNNTVESPSIEPAGKPKPVVDKQAAVKQFEKVEGPKMTIAGKAPTEKSDEELATEGVGNLYQKMMDKKKDALLQQRSDNMKLAQFNALGNALRAMVQPIGWAVGGDKGITAPVQEADNRQYLDAFNRAVKATEDMRNLDSEEAAFQLDMAQRNADRIQSRKDKEADKLFDAKIKAEYAKERHQYTMEEIAARGDVQKQVASIRANNVKKNGKAITEANLKTAQTQWYRYLGRYWDDIGRGIDRKEKRGPLSFGEFLTTPEGGGYSVDYSGSSNIDWEDSGAASSSASAPTIQWE